MKLTIPKPKVRQPKARRKQQPPRPKVTDTMIWASFVPPSETEWNEFVREARASGSKILNDILDQPVAPVEDGDRNQINKHLHREKNEMKVKVRGVRPGGYKGELLSVEQREGDFGDSVLHTFVIHKGTFDGQEIGRFTPPPEVGKVGGKFLEGMLGRPLVAAEDIDYDQLIRQMFHIFVEQTKSGAIRVERAIPVDEQADAAA